MPENNFQSILDAMTSAAASRSPLGAPAGLAEEMPAEQTDYRRGFVIPPFDRRIDNTRVHRDLATRARDAIAEIEDRLRGPWREKPASKSELYDRAETVDVVIRAAEQIADRLEKLAEGQAAATAGMYRKATAAVEAIEVSEADAREVRDAARSNPQHRSRMIAAALNGDSKLAAILLRDPTGLILTPAERKEVQAAAERAAGGDWLDKAELSDKLAKAATRNVQAIKTRAPALQVAFEALDPAAKETIESMREGEERAAKRRANLAVVA